MSRQCRCGGAVRAHNLTGDREAWTCNACGAYSVIERNTPPIEVPESYIDKQGLLAIDDASKY